MIRRLILAGQSYAQLIIVLFGSLAGLLLLMLSLQIYGDVFKVVESKKESISKHFLVLNKPVSLVNTVSGTASTFDPLEIEALRKIKGVERVAEFRTNLFNAKASFDFNGSGMSTDMIFESVPAAFLEIDPQTWTWSPGKKVPMILPSEYLNLYNSGFAPVQNLPQITKGMAKVSGLRVTAAGAGFAEEFPAEIVAFTDRINSILVPDEFLNYANTKYGFRKSAGASRVVIMSHDLSEPELMRVIDEMGYDTNLELLKSGKTNALLNAILGLLLSVGFVIILMSLLSFVQYSQLLINRSGYEIRTLVHLGYRVKVVFRSYFMFYLFLMLVVFVLAIAGLFIVKFYLTGLLLEKGIEIGSGVSPQVILMAVAVLSVFVVLNAILTYRTILSMAKPS